MESWGELERISDGRCSEIYYTLSQSDTNLSYLPKIIPSNILEKFFTDITKLFPILVMKNIFRMANWDNQGHGNKVVYLYTVRIWLCIEEYVTVKYLFKVSYWIITSDPKKSHFQNDQVVHIIHGHHHNLPLRKKNLNYNLQNCISYLLTVHLLAEIAKNRWQWLLL